MGYKIGADVGGTFTDLLMLDENGHQKLCKTPSTPKDPSIGLMNGLKELAAGEGISFKEFLSRLDLIVHGTTITTNAVITRKYAKTGYITNKGFRDYLNERRGMKRTVYEPFEAPPIPIVPRYLIQVVEGRIDCDGKEITPLKEADAYAAAVKLRKEKVEAVAVCLFFSFLNPSHERRVREILEKELPGVYVSLSSDVLPQVRIYERGSTTVFNACVGPILRSYMDSLRGKLKQDGFKGTLLLMQSNGGVMSPEVAMEFAVNTLLSGPAGGPPSAILLGETHGIKNMITIDMGGTSLDACLIRDQQPEITVENEVAEYRMAMPSLAVHSIGAGGGSIGYIDKSGILRVGPQSAGASPGPACYGTGGIEPTVTDADVILGYLNPTYFNGGKMKLYPEKAEKVVREKVAQPLGLDIFQAAEGMYKIVNTNMAQAVRVVSVSKGYDPRGAMLVAAGGAGAVHACDIAKELEMSLILAPKLASFFCAMGMLISNLRHDFTRVAYMLMKEGFINYEQINSSFKEMKHKGYDTLKREDIAPEEMKFHYACDMRYEGQFNEIEVPMPEFNGSFSPSELPALLKSLNQCHDTLYGYCLSGSTAELMCLRLVAEGITQKLELAETKNVGEDPSSAIKAQRKIYHGGKVFTVPIFDGDKLGNGYKIPGPAIIEETSTTIFVTPDYNLVCDKYNNYLMYSRDKNLEEILKALRR